MVVNPINAVISTEIQLTYREDDDDRDLILRQYLDDFVEDAALHGIDISYVYGHEINIHFGSWEPTLLAGLSTGYNNDKIINIYINEGSWAKRGEVHRKLLMYHELAHDIFNLSHTDNTELMDGGTLSIDRNDLDAVLEEFWNYVK